MQILITGANGFIGSSLLKGLPKDKLEIVPIDISKGNILNYDVTKIKDLENLFERYSPEVIIHLAAISSTDQSYHNAILTQKLNFMGTVNLLELAENLNSNLKYFILASSAEVYGGYDQKEFKENDKPQPLSPYAASKVAAEAFVLMKGTQKNLKTCCIRFCNTFGRILDRKFIIEYLFHSFLTNQSPIIHSPDSIREFMYIPDHIDVYKNVLKKRPSGILNASSGESCSILELALKIKKITNSNKPITKKKVKTKTVIRLNLTKIKNLGFKPKFGLDDSLTDYYDKIMPEFDRDK